MPLTLQQAKVGMADKVDQQVTDNLMRSSAILEKLTFDDAVSPGTGGSTMTYGYMMLKTPSVAEGRALNAEYTPGEAIKEKKTTELKIFGGAFQVDRVLEESAAKSEIAFQVEQKTLAAKNKFHNDFINGDSSQHNTEFDGIDKLVTGTDTEVKITANIDLSTAEKIKENAPKFAFELDKWFETMDGKPHLLLVNSRMKTILGAVARELNYKTLAEDSFGRKVDAYDGIPLLDMGKYYDASKSKTVNVVKIADSTNLTSIYAVQLGLDAVHGVSLKGGNIIRTYLPDLKAPGALKKGEVEVVAGIACKNSKKIGALRNIKVA